MSRVSSTVLNARRILRQNGFKRGSFKVEVEKRKTRLGWEYREAFIHMRQEVSEEALKNLTHDGLRIHLKSRFPIFKF